MRVPSFALSAAIDCESKDAAELLIRIKREAVSNDDLLELMPPDEEEEEDDDEDGWILSKVDDDEDSEDEDGDDDDDEAPGNALVACVPLLQYLAAIALNLQIGDAPLVIPTEEDDNAKFISKRHHLKYLTRFVGVPKDRACLPNFLRYNPKPSYVDYLRPREFCPVGPYPGGAALDKKKDFFYREEYSRFFKDFNNDFKDFRNEFPPQQSERDDPWFDRRRGRRQSECDRWNNSQDNHDCATGIPSYPGRRRRQQYDRSIRRYNPNEHAVRSPYLDCHSHNRRMRNCYPRDEECNYVDPWEIEEKRQHFASDRELGCRLLEDTLLEKRAYLDKCAEAAYLDRYECAEATYPPSPYAMERHVNDYVQSRMQYDLNNSHPDRMRQRRYRNGFYNGSNSMYPYNY